VAASVSSISGKYTPRVVVKFIDELQIPYETDDAVEDFFHMGQIGPWLELKTQFPGITIGRLFTSVAPERIVKFVTETAHQNPDYHPPNFLTYFAVNCPTTVNRKKLVKVLLNKQHWPHVQNAYVQGGPGASPGVILGPQETNRQGYLGPAPPPPPTIVPGGIDAKYAWAIPGGDGGGASLQFVDIEQGWLIKDDYGIDHEDLPTGISLAWGNGGREIGHGTAVLGILTAISGNSIAGCAFRKDMVGIAPNVGGRFVVSFWNGSTYSLSDAILRARVDVLKQGDVLLIEAQTGDDCLYGHKIPVEVEDDVFDQIELATQSGVIVVEAAGNQVANLDWVKGSSDRYVLTRCVRDSKAIIVGASTYNTRLPTRNFGSRIDCYAWGEYVVTTGFDPTSPVPSSPETKYYMFDGTSSASAIIAGAALAVQGIKKNYMGGPAYTPTQMRNILIDPTTSTPSANGTAVDQIGVMPDLKQIIGTWMGLAPDVYVRDFVGDTGATPNMGSIASSPDIILRPAPAVADPQADFGQGSGEEDNDALSADAQTGKDHVVYVRVRNRGTADTVNVSVTVYWSPAATLMTPNLWTRVDVPPDLGMPSVIIPNVPMNGDLTVSPAIPWPASRMPASTGHHCFVGLIGNGADPAPSPDSIVTMSDFENFIRNNNNATLRNFNVVTYDPANWTGFSEHWLHFFITGPHDETRLMKLEFLAETHENTQIQLQVPFRYRGMIAGLGTIEDNEELHVASAHLNPRAVCYSREQMFPLRLMVDSTLRVRIPTEFGQQRSLLTIRQLYEDREVGRITWRLHPQMS
jgi:serine protease